MAFRRHDSRLKAERGVRVPVSPSSSVFTGLRPQGRNRRFPGEVPYPYALLNAAVCHRSTGGTSTTLQPGPRRWSPRLPVPYPALPEAPPR
ncbi:hypothetical protein B005_1249 [Nocardiopsis alba ATCC BAA-2165]|uniref:Uncharacterized protein n=1 Tax=Nocardiopsis alba (strain ATCC BAA-2165 / BE74) TaxID=1205910 RepID=J7LIM4_NOCAA|nr:hypothetical protein B005_1249 [Nocardiopsis alba ATCC BAA-2165]